MPGCAPMDDGSVGSPLGKPATFNGRIQITPYALPIGRRWFAALRFSLRGHKLGDDLVLREQPCASAEEARTVAKQYIHLAYH